MNSNVCKEKPRLLLIHGTFAYQEGYIGSAWWQRDSDFHRWCVDQLGDAFSVQPETEIFTWSGENLEVARRSAATELAKRIRHYEEAGIGYCFIAHSHGGSVLFDALTEANHYRTALPNLVRWITVGTPFLRYKAEKANALLTLPIGLLLFSFLKLVPLHFAVFETQWWDVVANPDYVLAGMLVVLDALLLYVFFALAAHLGRCNLSRRREAKLERNRARAYEALSNRYAAFVSDEDEAVNALGSTLAFNGKLIVRPRRWWGFMFAHVLAPLGDAFIWRQLARRAQGNDLPGLSLEKVLPVPSEGAVLPGLDQNSAQEVITSANRRLWTVAGTFRRSLHLVAFSGQPLAYLRSSLQDAGAIESLVHTTYFDNSTVRMRLALALHGELPPLAAGARSTAKVNRVDTALLAVGASVLLCVCILALGTAIQTLLTPLDPTSSLTHHIRTMPFVAATYADPEAPYELLRVLAERGRSELVNDISNGILQPDDRRKALANVAMGMLASGRQLEAMEMARELGSAEQAIPTLPKGVAGPILDTSNGDQAVVKALAYTGLLNLAGEFVDKFSSPSAQMLTEKVIEGLIESRQENSVAFWLPRLEASYRQAAMIDRLSVPHCADNESVLTMKAADPELLASLLIYRMKCGRVDDPIRALQGIDSAPERVRAGCSIARILAARGHHMTAVGLLRAERAALSTFPRHPLDGLAVLHTQYARAFVDVGEITEARLIMESIESTGDEPIEGKDGYFIVDTSPPERARVWAMVGNKARALRWWYEVPEGMGEVDAKLDLLREIAVALWRATGEGIRGSDYDFARRDSRSWYRMVKTFQEIGEYDAWREGAGPVQRARRLTVIEGSARMIDDPRQRSRAASEIAQRLLDEGSFVRAMAVNSTALPQDQVTVLAKAAQRLF